MVQIKLISLLDSIQMQFYVIGTPNEKQRSACYKDWLLYSGSCYYFNNYNLSWDNAQVE
jgi:hypothetical protein